MGNYNDLKKLLSENTYPGRGIIIGKSAAVTVYSRDLTEE